MDVRTFLICLILLFTGPAFFVFAASETPSSLETTHFRIFFSDEDERLAAALAAEAETIYADVVGDIGVAPRPGIDVYIEHTHEAFRRRQPQQEKVPEWAVGLAYPAHNLIILKAPAAALHGTVDPFRNFRHELAHLTLHQALRGVRVPRWLDEGLAMYEAREWTLRTTAVISALTLKKAYIPLAALTNEFPVSVGEAEAAYAQSFSMVAYLLNRQGRERFHEFIRQVQAGKTLSQSTQAAFGLSFYDLEQRWHRYLRIRYTWVPVITSSAALWFVASLLFLWVYARKRRAAQRKVAEWELEEMWEAGHPGERRRSKFLPDVPEDEGD